SLPRGVRLKLSVTLRNFMECGGKRSATPLWLERIVLGWVWHKHKPKRRRASLAAALHMAVADTFNRTPLRRFGSFSNVFIWVSGFRRAAGRGQPRRLRELQVNPQAAAPASRASAKCRHQVYTVWSSVSRILRAAGLREQLRA